MKTRNDYFNGWSTRVIFGSIAWLGTGVLSLLGVIELDLVEQFFLLAPLVITPLGLALVEIPDQARQLQLLYNLIRVAQPFGAMAVIIAFLLPSGLLAGVLAASWLGITALIALLGCMRFVSRGFVVTEEIGIDAGLAYLLVGGGWLVLARLGANPLGFGDLIVLLTAVHFHYAGFAAPIISNMVGRTLMAAPQAMRIIHRISLVGIIAGMPLVAAGITFSPLLEVSGAIGLATSLAMFAFLMIFSASRIVTHRVGQILLTVSAICLIIGMVFTCLYAVSEFTGYYWVVIPQMVKFHGLTNAFGFALCGLLAGNILHSQHQAASFQPIVEPKPR